SSTVSESAVSSTMPVASWRAPYCSTVGGTLSSLAIRSSRLTVGASVMSSTSITSIKRSSCLATWSTSAWPASTVSVIRERPGSVLGPTVMVSMLKPRRRILPLTRAHTPGLSSTSTRKTRSWLCTVRQLPEVVQALAERHDRVDVGLGVDPEVDQEGPGCGLGLIEGRLDLLVPVYAPGFQPVGFGQLHEVGHHREVDLGPNPAVKVVLELADHAQAEVVEEDDLNRHLVLDSNGELLGRHHETALAGDAPDVLVRSPKLGPQRRGEGETHGA